MKRTLYIVMASNTRAKVYQARLPADTWIVVFEQITVSGREMASAQAEPEIPSNTRDPDLLTSIFTADDAAFAQDLCKVLRTERRAGRFSGLLLIAPVSFLAAIHLHLDRECRDVLVGTIDKDPSEVTEEYLASYLQKIRLPT